MRTTTNSDASTRALQAGAAVSLVLGVAARLYSLDRLPGINGDEAWYGANLQALAAGQPAFWFTPSGNPLNPLHSGPLAVLLALFPPSPALLRLPEVVWSICALALAVPLLRRHFGARVALIAVMLLSASPVAIAYARMGWDVSATPLAALLAIAAASAQRPVLCALAFGAALSIHPTNIFLGPIVLAVWAPELGRRYAAASPQVRRRLLMWSAILCAAALAVLGVMLWRAAHNPHTSLPPMRIALGRMFSPAEWARMAAAIASFFSGVPTLTFIAGPVSPAVNAVGAIVATCSLLALLPARDALRRTGTPAAWLLAGLVLSLAVFTVVAGPNAVRTSYERYLLFLLVPLAIAIASGIDTLPPARAAAVALVLTSGLSGLTWAGYFSPLLERGGEAELSFRTGAVEPKRAAYEFAKSASAGRALVVCHEWWTYWPVRFLAAQSPDVVVALADDAPLPPGVRERIPQPVPPRDADVFDLVFEGGVGADAHSGEQPAFTASDAAGRPVVHVFRVTPPAR